VPQGPEREAGDACGAFKNIVLTFFVVLAIGLGIFVLNGSSTDIDTSALATRIADLTVAAKSHGKVMLGSLSARAAAAAAARGGTRGASSDAADAADEFDGSLLTAEQLGATLGTQETEGPEGGSDPNKAEEDEDQLAPFLTTAAVPAEGDPNVTVTNGAGDEEPSVNADLEARFAAVTAAAALLREKTDNYNVNKMTQDFDAEVKAAAAAHKEQLKQDAEQSAGERTNATSAYHQRLEDAAKAQEAHLDEIKKAEEQLEKMQAMKKQMLVMQEAVKERDSSIAAAKVVEETRAGLLVCADNERHLMEKYMQVYSCRFDAVNTAPNPLFGAPNSAINTTVPEGLLGGDVSLDVLAVTLFLQSWAANNPRKLGLDGAPGLHHMAAPITEYDKPVLPTPVGRRRVLAADDVYAGSILRYINAEKSPYTFYSVHTFAGQKEQIGAGVTTTLDAATVMRALLIPGIANLWGGAQPRQHASLAAKVDAYTKVGFGVKGLGFWVWGLGFRV